MSSLLVLILEICIIFLKPVLRFINFVYPFQKPNIVFVNSLYCFSIFKFLSHYVAQACLELMIPLPQPPGVLGLQVCITICIFSSFYFYFKKFRGIGVELRVL
jgi:hypothetical protein